MSLVAISEPKSLCFSKITAISFSKRLLGIALKYLPSLFRLASFPTNFVAYISPIVRKFSFSKSERLLFIAFNNSPSFANSSDFLTDLKPLRFAI